MPTAVAEVVFLPQFVCVSVCFCPQDISKTDAARNTKLDKEVFPDEFWKPIYVDVKRSKVIVTIHKNIAGVGL